MVTWLGYLIESYHKAHKSSSHKSFLDILKANAIKDTFLMNICLNMLERNITNLFSKHSKASELQLKCIGDLLDVLPDDILLIVAQIQDKSKYDIQTITSTHGSRQNEQWNEGKTPKLKKAKGINNSSSQGDKSNAEASTIEAVSLSASMVLSLLLHVTDMIILDHNPTLGSILDRCLRILIVALQRYTPSDRTIRQMTETLTDDKMEKIMHSLSLVDKYGQQNHTSRLLVCLLIDQSSLVGQSLRFMQFFLNKIAEISWASDSLESTNHNEVLVLFNRDVFHHYINVLCHREMASLMAIKDDTKHMLLSRISHLICNTSDPWIAGNLLRLYGCIVDEANRHDYHALISSIIPFYYSSKATNNDDGEGSIHLIIIASHLLHELYEWDESMLIDRLYSDMFSYLTTFRPGRSIPKANHMIESRDQSSHEAIESALLSIYRNMSTVGFHSIVNSLLAYCDAKLDNTYSSVLESSSSIRTIVLMWKCMIIYLYSEKSNSQRLPLDIAIKRLSDVGPRVFTHIIAMQRSVRLGQGSGEGREDIRSSLSEGQRMMSQACFEVAEVLKSLVSEFVPETSNNGIDNTTTLNKNASTLAFVSQVHVSYLVHSLLSGLIIAVNAFDSPHQSDDSILMYSNAYEMIDKLISILIVRNYLMQSIIESILSLLRALNVRLVMDMDNMVLRLSLRTSDTDIASTNGPFHTSDGFEKDSLRQYQSIFNVTLPRILMSFARVKNLSNHLELVITIFIQLFGSILSQSNDNKIFHKWNGKLSDGMKHGMYQLMDLCEAKQKTRIFHLLSLADNATFTRELYKDLNESYHNEYKFIGKA